MLNDACGDATQQMLCMIQKPSSCCKRPKKLVGPIRQKQVELQDAIRIRCELEAAIQEARKEEYQQSVHRSRLCGNNKALMEEIRQLKLEVQCNEEKKCQLINEYERTQQEFSCIKKNHQRLMDKKCKELEKLQECIEEMAAQETALEEQHAQLQREEKNCLVTSDTLSKEFYRDQKESVEASRKLQKCYNQLQIAKDNAQEQQCNYQQLKQDLKQIRCEFQKIEQQYQELVEANAQQERQILELRAKYAIGHEKFCVTKCQYESEQRLNGDLQGRMTENDRFLSDFLKEEKQLTKKVCNNQAKLEDLEERYQNNNKALNSQQMQPRVCKQCDRSNTCGDDDDAVRC